MKRRVIIDAFVNKLKTIRRANGYNTDAGANTQDNRVEAMAEDEDYFIDVVAGSWDSEDMSDRVRRWMTISVSFGAQGDSAISTVENITADVIKAVYDDVTFGGVAINTEENGGAFDKDVSDQLYSWGEVDFKVLYDTVSGEI